MILLGMMHYHGWFMAASDSMPVLKAIVKLWINVRVHSFTHKWSDVLIQRKKEAAAHEKALRKSLKQRNTDKDHNTSKPCTLSLYIAIHYEE